MNNLKIIADEMRDCARLAHGVPRSVRINASTLSDWAAVLELAAARQATPFTKPVPLTSAQRAGLLEDRPAVAIATDPRGQALGKPAHAPLPMRSVHITGHAKPAPAATAGLLWHQRDAAGWLVAVALALLSAALIVAGSVLSTKYL